MRKLVLILLATALGLPLELVSLSFGGNPSADELPLDDLPFEESTEDASDTLELLKVKVDLVFAGASAWAPGECGVSGQAVTCAWNIAAPTDVASHFCRPPPAC